MNAPPATRVHPGMSTSSLLAPERWRKPVSFCFALAWLAAALFLQPAGFGEGWHEGLEWVGFALLIVAALGRVWAYLHIGGRKNEHLCTTGPYSLCRNPLYFFSFVGVAGASLALQHALLALASALVFLAYYSLVIRAEEIRLHGLFGAAFTDYARAVPRFWPRPAAPDHDRELIVQPRLFARTLVEVFWFLAAIVFIELIEVGKLHHFWTLITAGV